MIEKIDTTSNFGRLVHLMNRAYGCFLIWKYIRKSISIPENGRKEADRRAGIMNRYNGIFTGILYATENTFITDLYKFSDKSKSNLRLQTLIENLPDNDRRIAETLLDTVKDELRRIKTLRHNATAHEPRNPKEEKIFTLEIEKIFLVVQQILNMISRSHGNKPISWELWEADNDASLTQLLNDLEHGHQVYVKSL